MKLRFLSLIGLLLSLWMTGVHALGVGEIELNSHLNQKLAAEIPLLDASGLRADEVLVSLGSSEDFERAGVERFYYLTDLRFEVFIDGRGPRIRVTSRQPVTEPYLNFIVEVLWPNGRMLKEFTLLLDPPTYEAAVSRPQTDGPTSTRVAPAPDRPLQEAASEESSFPAVPTSSYTRPAGAAPPSVPPSDGVSTTGQTLWGIAERYNPDASLTVGQYMLAIQRRNPDAFIRENINLMKGGVRLQMPGADEARELGAGEAAAEVARQTAKWRGDEADAPAVASNETPETAAPVPVQEAPELRSQMDAGVPAEQVTSSAEAPASGPVTGRLEIVGDTGDNGAAQSPAANADVAVLQEENQRLQREVQELGYQSDREKEIAASEIAVKERQLEVKDQQLAELRKQLEAAQSQLADRRGQSSEDQNQPGTPWWQSTMVLLTAGLIVVLALVGGLVIARRRKAAAAMDAPAVSFDRVEPVAAPAPGTMARAAAVGGASVAAVAAADDNEDRETPDFLDEESAAPSPSQGDRAEEDTDYGKPSPSMQTSDVISEADIYAAYGRYPHAIGLLLGALEDDPYRHDVRLKLLEVAVSANDSETFERHIQTLVDLCDDQDILLAARELEETFTGTTIERKAEARTEAGTEPGSEAGDGADDPLSGEDDFGLDLDDDLSADSADSVDRSVEEEFLLELDDVQDPDADLPSRPAEATVEEHGAYAALATGDDQDLSAVDQADTSGSDVLGGDLGIDFDDAEPIETKTSAARSSAAAETGDALSLDDALDDPLDDELDIDELLADLDEPEPAGSAPTAAPSAVPEDVRFTRVGAGSFPAVEPEVPLLDPADTVTSEDLLADDDDLGIEDLDDLLADLDQAEERSALNPADPATPKTAEILTFSRPRNDDFARTPALAEPDDADDDGFDFGTAEDAAETKLDLAQAYIEMGDSDGAQDILHEVLSEGNPAQRQLAQSLLDSLAS